jgi:thioester reductase-like protein
MGGVLLTGATGFVGQEVLARFLDRDDRHVFALVRAEDDAAAAARLPHHERLTAVAADIERPGLGLAPGRAEWLAERVGTVIHCAASVSFGLGLEESRRVNVEGTRRIAELAERCAERGDGLQRLTYVSTAYVAGAHRGLFREDDLDVGQGFRNAYERSKFEAECLLRDRVGHLPLQVLRPSIVVGDSRTGWTSSFNVLYPPLRAFAHGAMPALPARRRSPVDVVPVDYVADAVFELSQRPVERMETYHLVAGPEATTVEEIVGLASKQLDRPLPLVVPPPLYRRLMHPLLLWRSDGRRKRALERLETFFPYFTMRVRYRNERARRLLEPEGIQVSPFRSYFGRLIDFAQQADWGAQRPSRRDAREPTPA